MALQLRFERTEDDIIAVWLESPQRSVVVLDSWLLDQLHMFFDTVEAGPEPAGLIVLSASTRVFIAGADLSEIDQLSDDQLHAYLTEGADAFARICALPCPSVAAINGAALGGGLELALHCDGLVAARGPADRKPYRIGLPEASLGICPGWGGTQMLPARIDPAQAIEMAAIGDTRTLDTVPEGLIDQTVDHVDDLFEAAVHWLRNFEDSERCATPRCIDESNQSAIAEALETVRATIHPSPAANAVLEAIECGLSDGFAAGLAAERRLLVSLRHTDQARSKLETFFAKNA